MHLSSDVQIPDGLLAANALLAGNSRQQFRTSTHTLYQGFEVAISSTAIGISGTLYDTRTESRYTGKERDAESGLDYFGARYYASNMGRWMSPDWADKPEAVPYSSLDNPQSLNLYGYVGNNPLSKADADGHCWPCITELKEFGTGVAKGISNSLGATRSFDIVHSGMESGTYFTAKGKAETAGVVTGTVVGVAITVLAGDPEAAAGEVVEEAGSMRAAQRSAMRDEGIPTSQQPSTQTSTPAGKQYTYDVPAEGGGTETKVVQRNNGTDRSHPGQAHVEAGSPKPGNPTPTDSIGRPRLDSNKTKVNVKKPDGN
jgi:RHS repeat-associated protein